MQKIVRLFSVISAKLNTFIRMWFYERVGAFLRRTSEADELILQHRIPPSPSLFIFYNRSSVSSLLQSHSSLLLINGPFWVSHS